MNEKSKWTSHYDRYFNFCVVDIIQSKHYLTTVFMYMLFQCFPWQGSLQFRIARLFLNKHSLVWKKKTAEKELHAGHVHFLYTVYAVSCIYIRWYRETKTASVGRKLVMGTETMKVPRGYNVMLVRIGLVLCHREGILRYYTYIGLWSTNIYESQMNRVVFGRINSTWRALIINEY